MPSTLAPSLPPPQKNLRSEMLPCCLKKGHVVLLVSLLTSGPAMELQMQFFVFFSAKAVINKRWHDKKLKFESSKFLIKTIVMRPRPPNNK